GGGSVTFTMNKGNFLYLITGDSELTYSENQTVTRENLGVGEYNISIIDIDENDNWLDDCFPVYSFIFEAPITYSLKWWFEYFDIHGVETRVEIYGKNFTGTASEIEYVGSAPVTIDWKGRGQDKY